MQGSNSFAKLFTKDICKRRCACNRHFNLRFLPRLNQGKIKKLSWQRTQKEENSVCKTNTTFLPPQVLLMISAVSFEEIQFNRSFNTFLISFCCKKRNMLRNKGVLVQNYLCWCNAKPRWKIKMQIICQKIQRNILIHM